MRRARPELLLGAAALLICAGVLVAAAAGVLGGPVETAPTAMANPFEEAEEFDALPTQSADAEPKAPAPPQAVNINTADQAQLETLPGIGPEKARSILEWRMVHGAFANAEQLLEIPGIGEATLEKLLAYIVV